MNVISDLWNGNIAPCEHCGAKDRQANALYAGAQRSREALKASLAGENHDLLENYGKHLEDYLLRMMELAFREGLVLGIRLTTEVFSENG